MKVLNKKTNTLRNILITISIIAGLLLAYGLFAYSTHTWPFNNQGSSSNTDGVQPDPSDETPGSTQDEDGDQPKDNEDDVDEDDPNYVRPDISNPPTDDSQYPIETERYRIDKRSATGFSVELYPIINNPEYSDYNAQLRDYKNEVLRYLKSRYGNIDNFNISWLPEDAKNL